VRFPCLLLSLEGWLVIHTFVARSPKWSPSLFGSLFKTPVIAMVEPPLSYLEPHGPPRLPARQGVSIGTAGCACLGFVVRYLFDRRLPSCTISAGTATVIARRKATSDELRARAEANGYQRGRTGKKTEVESQLTLPRDERGCSPERLPALIKPLSGSGFSLKTPRHPTLPP
jgi:hypothetical protein